MHLQKQLTDLPLQTGARPLRATLLALVILVFAPGLQAAGAGDFTVRDAHAWHDEDGWFLDAQFNIALSKGAREALENGVPLVFELQVQIVRKNKWYWDTVEYERRLLRQLQFHALSRSFIVRDISSGTQGVYRKLGDALFAAGMVDSLLLTDDSLAGDRDYIVRVRGSHDIESLPTPVRLLAYVSSEWDMNSQWYAWPLAR